MSEVTAGRTIKVLHNSATLLDLLAERGALNPAELAKALGMPRPSVYRLIEALEVVGFVSMDADGSARLGLEVLHLAEAALLQIPDFEQVQSVVSELQRQSGQTVYFGVRRGSRIVCLDRREGATVNLLVLSPGGTLPPHAGALSRAISAFDDDVRSSIQMHAPYERFTTHTITTLDEWEIDAEATRGRGYSVSDQDVTIGVAALGMPVFSGEGRVVGALSVAGLRDDILRNSAVIVDQLTCASSQLGAQFGR